MRLVLFLLAVGLPSLARADFYPYVQDGPAIVGVKTDEAWVTWYTAHHQGDASGVNECRTDAATGTPNDTIPTLTLSPPAGGGAVFTDPTCARNHAVHLTGLSAGTAYTFTLDKTFQGGAAAAGGFRTAPDIGALQPFRFIFYGDNRNNPADLVSTRPRHEALITGMLAHDSDVAFVVNGGDYALNITVVAGDDQGYTEFFDVERPLLATRPIFAGFGNHETMKTTFYDQLLSGQALSAAAHPYYYSVDWGNAHIALLDSFEGAANPLLNGERSALITDAQAQWLDTDLAAARQAGKLIFVVSHQGPYAYSTSIKVHGGLADVQNKVLPLMIKYGALGIFAGHDHMYEHGHEGCVDYFVVGSGGAESIDPDLNAPGVIAGTSNTSYLVVAVTAEGATGTAKDDHGNIVDMFQFQPASCSGADAGVAADGAALLDAGPFVDAAYGTDASALALDAGSIPASDASSPGEDAAPGVAGADASDKTASSSGCGCTAAGDSWLGLGGLLMLSALWRRSARDRDD